MKSAKDMVLVELISGDTLCSIHRITKSGIQLEQLKYLDELTVRFCVSAGAYKWIKRNLKSGETARIINYIGPVWRLGRAIKHPLVIGMLLLTLLGTVILPRKVLFVQVAGNTSLDKKLILDRAEDCGIGFWSNRSEIRSETVKNALLSSLPELKWAAITTNGCTATVHIKEGEPESANQKFHSMNLIAASDGIVQELTVLRGTPLCKVGDAVTKGQVLISGYADCGLTIQATGAEGEVYGLTERKIQAVIMGSSLTRGEPKEMKTVYSVRIGKKLIKLYKDSGISDGSCVKIKSTKNVCLPGGKSLPVDLITEVLYSVPIQTGGQFLCDHLTKTVRNYITDHMQAGRVLNEEVSIENGTDFVLLKGAYTCREMIGLTTNEEIIEHYGEND